MSYEPYDEQQFYRLQSLLQKRLGPEYLSNRSGQGGTRLTYIEGWRAINLANEIFGFNGWYSEIRGLETDYCDRNPDTGRFDVGVTARVRVWLKDGTSHEDVGYGKIDNCRSKGDALDKCKKEAVTDGLKRSVTIFIPDGGRLIHLAPQSALRLFGSLLGNCIYDKTYLDLVGKMKAPKDTILVSSLHRATRGLPGGGSTSVTAEEQEKKPSHQKNASGGCNGPAPQAQKHYQVPTALQDAMADNPSVNVWAPPINKKKKPNRAPSSDHWGDEDAAYDDVDLDASNYHKTYPTHNTEPHVIDTTGRITTKLNSSNVLKRSMMDSSSSWQNVKRKRVSEETSLIPD